MRLPTPELRHPPEVYQAIIAEHEGSAERLGARLEQLGWSMAEAAWAAVNWSFTWLAAAIASERERRGMIPTALPPNGPHRPRGQRPLGEIPDRDRGD